MPECSILYIPEHLHQNDKPIIEEFHDSELLFWRLGKNSSIAPYSTISLFDVSCNRSGVEPNILSTKEDVLWNIEQNATQEKYISDIVTLIIRRIFPDNPPNKPILDDSNKENIKSVLMKLIHDPLPCNYAHSMFMFELDNVSINKENYKNSFGSGIYKNLRKACRDELHKAILKKEISI